MKFDKEYYKKIIDNYGYNSLNFSGINLSLPGIPIEIVESTWVCSYNLKQEDVKQSSKTLFTTGIGLSGAPHMGTISQIIRAIKLQKAGNFVQIVLGDVDAYTGRHTKWEETQILKHKYLNFIKLLGFDFENGIVRCQSIDSENIFKTHSLISGYFTDEIANESEEDLHNLYVQNNKAESKMTFNREYSLSLMCADFISPLINKEFDKVIVFLGIDEHKYVLAANKLIQLMKNEFSGLNNKKVSALYSSIILGFNDFPKMSKSFPESSINICSSNENIRRKVMYGDKKVNDAFYNVDFQLMNALNNLSKNEIKSLENHCLSFGSLWEKDKEDLVKQIINIKEAWENYEK